MYLPNKIWENDITNCENQRKSKMSPKRNFVSHAISEIENK